jgi:hypothetical protein
LRLVVNFIGLPPGRETDSPNHQSQILARNIFDILHMDLIQVHSLLISDF